MVENQQKDDLASAVSIICAGTSRLVAQFDVRRSFWEEGLSGDLTAAGGRGGGSADVGWFHVFRQGGYWCLGCLRGLRRAAKHKHERGKKRSRAKIEN